MRSVKFFSFFVMIVGGYYLFHGSLGILVNFTEKSNKFTIPPGSFFITLLIFGMLSFFSAYHLKKQKPWARELWLGLCLVLVSVFAIRLIHECSPKFFSLSYLMQPLIALVIALISWIFLNLSFVEPVFNVTNHHKNKTIVFVWLFGIGVSLSLGLFLGTLTKPSISDRIYFGKGKAFFPTSITTTQDQNYILAGAAYLSRSVHGENKKYPCAVKVDQAGNILWDYVPGDLNTLAEYTSVYMIKEEYLSGKSEYCSVEVLPDGDIFLLSADNCITLLNHAGKLRIQFSLKPEFYGFEKILTCKPVDNDFLLVGLSSKQNRGTSYAVPMLRYPQNKDYFYTFIRIDKTGKICWQNMIKQHQDLNPNNTYKQAPPICSLQTYPDGNGIFLISGDEATEIVRFNAKGDFLAQTSLMSHLDIENDETGQNRYILSTPTKNNDSVTIVSKNTDPISIIRLDNNLHETGSTQKHISSGVINAAYTLHDGSLMLFGYQSFDEIIRKNYVVPKKSPMIIKTDGSLRHMLSNRYPVKSLISHAPGVITEEFAYVAATLSPDNDTFTVVKKMVKNDISRNEIQSGLVILDLINVF